LPLHIRCDLNINVAARAGIDLCQGRIAAPRITPLGFFASFDLHQCRLFAGATKDIRRQ